MSTSNPYLTPGVRGFLEAIRDSEDQYAIQEGIAVWVDSKQFHARTVLKCLQLCLIKEDTYSDEKTRIWLLTECGREILKDDKYVPLIVRAQAGDSNEG